MAELTNRLHLKSDSTVTECICYTTIDEATPKTVTGGSTWEIKTIIQYVILVWFQVICLAKQASILP